MITKNTKYLLSGILLAMIILAPSSFVSAQTNDPVTLSAVTGGTCGVSGQGVCKQFCDAYDNIDSNPTSGSGAGACGTLINGQTLTCCVPTKCESNSIGIGKCVSGNSCGGQLGSIGINTSNCVPPKLCCVIPGPQNAANADQTTTVQPAASQSSDTIQPISGGTDVFTGQTNQTTPGGEAVGGLVTCNGLDCTLCDLLQLIKNVINFLTGIVFALAGGFVVWGGIEIMTAGGAEGKITEGRGRIWTAVLGIAIALGAWLFIGTLLQVLTNSPSVLPWNTIQCSSDSLQLKKYATGNDSGCTAKGGNCQDKIVACNGTYVPGLCLSQTWVNNANGQCCVPTKITPQATSCGTMPGSTCRPPTISNGYPVSPCPGKELNSGVCVNNETCCQP